MKSSARQPVDIAVFVVIPSSLLLLDVAGPMEVLRKANSEQDAVRYTVTYIGPSATVGSSIGLQIAGLSPLPASLPDGALVVVPGTIDVLLDQTVVDRAEAYRQEQVIVDWLRLAIRPGMRLVSICSGALMAARAGLLDGRDCTTHHGCVAELTKIAPSARVKENRLYVEDGERLTSAGVTAGIDLMLHLVAQQAGHAIALSIARHLVIYLRRGGADPQLSPWLEGRNHIHPTIHRAQDAVAADPTQDWSVETLAGIAGASTRNLSRLFNEHTGMSVIDYVNRMRIALARELLTGSQLDIEAVAERAGFASARQLRRTWSRFHDAPPSRMRSVTAVQS
jgi:transcriptional regulator GlxA family with amidase domain